VIVSFARYGSELTGKRFSPTDADKRKAIKLIKKNAEKLIEIIEDAEDSLEYNLLKCCENTLPYLKYLAEYEPLKVLRKDETRGERNFLYNLIRFLKRANLPCSTKFISYIMPMLETNFAADPRNLITNIRVCEKRFKHEQKQKQAHWDLLIKPPRNV
jgi:hypothetical protein